MEFLRSVKGSVSIFLCLILLPMVTYSTMIIDASRLQTSRTAIASAGDLAMNAALSEYEQILEDMYGLFATAGSEEEIEEQLKSYFKQTIEGELYKGTRDDYDVSGIAEDLIDKIFEADSEEDISNLIEMKVTDFDYKPVENSALSNPAIMKKQIVDYMKYKGPVSIAGGLLSKLDFLKDTEKQTEVVEKKVEYTETLSDIEDVCIKAFEAIEGVLDENNTKNNGYNYSAANSYNNYVTQSNAKKVKDNVTYIFERVKNKLKDMSACILMNERSAANSTDFSGITDVTSPSFEKEPDYTSDKITSEEIETYMDSISSHFNDRFDEEIGYFNNSGGVITLKDNIRDIMSKIKEINAEISEIDLSGGESGFRSEGVKTIENFFGLQNKACEIIKDDENKTILKNMLSFYYYSKALKEKYDQAFGQYETVWEKEKREKYKDEGMDDEKIEEAIKIDKENESGDYFKYEQLKQNIDSFYDYQLRQNYKQEITNFVNSAKDKSCYSNGMNDSLFVVKINVSSLYSRANDVYIMVTNAINALEDVKQKMTNSENKKNEWQGSINSVSEGATKTSMQSDLDTSTNGLNMGDVDALINVMKEIKGDFETVCDILKSVSFFERTLYNVPYDSYGSFDTGIYQSVANYKGSSDDISKLAEEIVEKGFNFDFSDGNPLFTTTAKIIDGKGEGQQFYNTLKSIYNPKKSTASEEQKKSVEKINDLTSTDENGTPEVKESDSGGSSESEDTGASDGTEEKKEDGEEGEKTEESISLGGIYESTYGEKAKEETGGDEKVSSMNLSSDKDSYKDSAKSATSSLKASTSVLKSISNIAAGIRDNAYLEEYFTEMFTCRTHSKVEDKRLLNGYSTDGEKTINTKNDWYGKEVEYILWGNADSSKNYAYTDAWIYAIRFALNAIYAFTATDIQTFALETATAIAGWTVIGVPIIQVSITIALALAESAYDMYLLHDGKDVAIYKNSSNFVCSPSGLVSSVAEDAKNKFIEVAEKQVKDTLDSALDSFSNKVYATVSDATEDVTNFVNDYVDKETKSIKTSIQNQFVNPIINSVLPVLNQVNETAEDIEDQLDDKVSDAIESAWGKIRENVDKMPEGILRTLTNEALGKLEDYKKGIVEDIKSYYRNIIDESTKPAKNLTEILTAEGSEEGYITKLIDSMNERIKTEVNKIGDGMKEKVQELGDDGVNNIKSVLHDEVDSAAEKISGKASDIIEEGAKHIDITDTPAKDSSASGGFTLNYKEYCKLLVFVRLSMGSQDIMLKRAAVIIEANVRTAPKNANDKFRIAKASTLVSVSADVDMGTLFPWMVSVSDTSGTDGSAEMELDLDRIGEYRVPINYQAVNGY